MDSNAARAISATSTGSEPVHETDSDSRGETPPRASISAPSTSTSTEPDPVHEPEKSTTSRSKTDSDSRGETPPRGGAMTPELDFASCLEVVINELVDDDDVEQQQPPKKKAKPEPPMGQPKSKSQPRPRPRPLRFQFTNHRELPALKSAVIHLHRFGPKAEQWPPMLVLGDVGSDPAKWPKARVIKKKKGKRRSARELAAFRREQTRKARQARAEQREVGNPPLEVDGVMGCAFCDRHYTNKKAFYNHTALFHNPANRQRLAYLPCKDCGKKVRPSSMHRHVSSGACERYKAAHCVESSDSDDIETSGSDSD